MQIKNKVIKITTDDVTEIFQATAKTVIKTLSVVFRNNTDTRYFSVFIKENETSNRGALIYEKSISKEGLYLTDLYLGPGNILEVQCSNYSSGDEIDVILQYIELS